MAVFAHLIVKKGSINICNFADEARLRKKKRKHLLQISNVVLANNLG